MTPEWKLSSETLLGQPAYKHRVTGELCLFGPNGQIFQIGENRYACLKPVGDTERIYYFKPTQSQIKKWFNSIGL